MSNPFKELENQEYVSPELKKKVMNEIEALSLITDFGELFTLNFGSIFGDLFQSNKK